MNWLRKYAEMNDKQKRDLKNKLSIIYNNIGFQVIAGLGLMYVMFWGFGLIDG